MKKSFLIVLLVAGFALNTVATPYHYHHRHYHHRYYHHHGYYHGGVNVRIPLPPPPPRPPLPPRP